MSFHHSYTRQVRLLALCFISALSAVVVVERASATATAAPLECIVAKSGATATLSWSDSGGTHVIRRDDRWIATPGKNVSTFVDAASPPSATYVVRTWRHGNSFTDRTCTPPQSTSGSITTPATTTAPPTTTTVPPATTTAPPTTTAVPSCRVTELLVPTCGAWLGAATTDAAKKYDYRVGLAEYEAVAQNEPDIQHFYSTGGKAIPTSTQRALAERPGHQRSLLLINWKPSTAHTWRQIANGEVDHLIESAAAGMRTYPHKFFLTIWHEPENDFGPGRQPADYVDMYRHVVAKLGSIGVTNVVYVWNMMGYSGHGYLYDSLYPGHDVVDWIAWDPYSLKGNSMLGLVNENCCRVPNWTGFYDWATRKSPGTPLMLAEWGFALSNPNGPSALDNGAAVLRDRFPALKAVVYWNENKTNIFRIDTPTEFGRSFGQAYRRFANADYFNQTSTAVAP